MFKSDFELNAFNSSGSGLAILLYILIRNRKYVSTLEKEKFNKEKNSQ